MAADAASWSLRNKRKTRKEDQQKSEEVAGLNVDTMMALPAATIRHLVVTRNRQLVMEAVVGGVMGVVFIALTCAIIFPVSWFIGGQLFGWSRAVNIGLGAIGIYLIVATWSAWRGVSPVDDLEYDPNSSGSSTAGLSLVTGLPIMDRQSLAGAGTALIAGPANILDAIGDLRRRLPSDQATIAAAESMLRQAASELKITAHLNPNAFVMLQRLALVKVRSENGELFIHPTAKGLEVMGLNA